MGTLTLTADQQEAESKIIAFLMDPAEVVFVLEGYSGTGKSTLVKSLIERIPNIQKTIKLLNAKASVQAMEILLTATTNKAAENFSLITGLPAGTIHSALGLMVRTDFSTGETSVTINKRRVNDPVTHKILFIDEASYIDSKLLSLIFKQTKYCKIILIGDPAQLTQVKSVGAPVFSANFPKATLSEVVRQTSEVGKPLHPITDLATKFRHTVNTGEFFNFKPDGHHIQLLDRDAFNERLLVEFKRDGWRHRDSKMLAWTNKCVVSYNQAIAEEVRQTPDFQVGDYAICNKFVTKGGQTIKTDQQVRITGIGPQDVHHFVKGRVFTLNDTMNFFFPNSMAEKSLRLKEAQAGNEWQVSQEITNEWIDLRHEYAQTVNKSQGSTYDMVFIDLDDISRCNSGDQIARMLYVAVSRARNHVFLTGDLV